MTTTITATSNFAPEDPSWFLADFGQQAVVNGTNSALVILSQQGADIMSGQHLSNRYKMLYATSQFPTLKHNDQVVIGVNTFNVMQTYIEGDGTFSIAMLQSTPGTPINPVSL